MVSDNEATGRSEVLATTAKPLERRNPQLTYGIDDVPPWYLCLFMALQHYLTMIGAIVSIPFILTPALCMAEDDPSRSYIISTMILVTGIVTLVQTTVGCRLPLVQGGTISFLVPTLAILNLPQWRCPDSEILEAMSHEDRTELWQIRMRELSGAIAVSALFQVIIGFGGIVGWLLKYISPLTIVPTVSLVGLSLFENAANAASQHWGIAAGTILMLTMYSQILVNVDVPIVVYRKGEGLRITWFALFKLFPVLLTIVVMWMICTILTVTDVLTPGHPGRADTKLKIITDSPWFRIPYPGQWGMPTVSLSSVLGMLAGVLACTVESISYYPTTSRMCGAPPPPIHAINRGIGIEGLGTVLAGLWGSGNGTNTFGENVGTIGVTKVGSRRVIQWACGLMILQGVISKFGAVFIIIPEPIVGGIFCVMFGMIAAFGLSALQYIDLNSARNLYILGFSIFFPLVLSKWMIKHSDVIRIGNDLANEVITVLLSTTILVGGFIGCLLDNIVPGSFKERGLEAWANEMEFNSNLGNDVDIPENEKCIYSTFDFPVGMAVLRREGSEDILCTSYTETRDFIAAGLTNGTIRLIKLSSSSNGEYTSSSLRDTEIQQNPGPTTGIKHRPVDKTHPITQTLLATYATGCVKSWHYTSGQCLYTIREKRQTLGLAYHNQLPKFVTVGDDANLYLYDEETRTMERAFHARSRVFSACFNPKSYHEIISGGWDDTIQFWDTRQPYAIRSITGPHICGEGLDISSNGKEILTCAWSKKNSIQLWDYGTGKLVVTLEPDSWSSQLYTGKYINALFIATGGSESNLFRIVDLRSHSTLASVRNLPGGVYSINVAGPSPVKRAKRGKHDQLPDLPKIAFCCGKTIYEVDVAR